VVQVRVVQVRVVQAVELNGVVRIREAVVPRKWTDANRDRTAGRNPAMRGAGITQTGQGGRIRGLVQILVE